MRRSAVWAASVTAAVLVLGGCGGGRDGMQVVTGARAERLIAASADKAEAAKTARMSGHVTIEVDGKSHTIDMDGSLDFRSAAVEFGLDFGDLGIGATHGMKLQMRVVDGVSYMRFASLPPSERRDIERMTNGKEWIKVDPAAMGLGATGSPGGIGDSNPGSNIGALRGIDGVDRIGVESVRGVETTHYRGRIDMSKVADRLPKGHGKQSEILSNLFGADWVVDVWVDGDGQARKMRMHVDSASMAMTEEFEFYDFGVPVDLSAPAPEDVIDFQDFQRSISSLRGTSRDAA